MLTQEKLKELLSYDPETGLFTWIKARSRRIKVGRIAGTKHCCGYTSISIDRVPMLAHRLAFLHETGSMPIEIDHINGVRSDNRWINLRSASHAENIRNTGMFSHNSSGHRGVYLRKDTNKWQAQIKLHGKHISLGCFDNPEDAALARDTAAKQIHGDFFRASDKEAFISNYKGVI